MNGKADTKPRMTALSGRWFSHLNAATADSSGSIVAVSSGCTFSASRTRIPSLVEPLGKARRWTINQAARLQTTPEAILEAIRRGPWLPEQLEQVRSKYALEDNPPQLQGVEPWMDRKPKIRRAV